MCNSKLLDPSGIRTGHSGNNIFDPLDIFKTPEEIETPEFTPEKDTTAEQKQVLSQRAAEEQRRKRLMAKGRQSTILTSGQGVTTPAPVKRKTLLGE